MDIIPDIEFKEAAYVVAFVIYVIERTVTHFRRKGARKRGAVTFEKNWELNEKLYPVMYDLMMQYHAIRVVIFQFHNGDKYYSGQSIQKMTCSHEVKRPGIKGMKPLFNGVQVPENIHHIISAIRTDDYYCVEDVTQLGDIDYKEALEFLEVKCLESFAIKDNNGRIVGLLTIHFNHIRAINSAQSQGILLTANEVSSLLNKYI
jgi:hypothetical protein